MSHRQRSHYSRQATRSEVFAEAAGRSMDNDDDDNDMDDIVESYLDSGFLSGLTLSRSRSYSHSHSHNSHSQAGMCLL
jgi:hypothetical protein